MTTLVTAFVYLLPASYTATAKVLVEPAKSPTLATEPRFGADVGQVLYTEIEIVLSRTVMEAVVTALELDKPGAPVGRIPIAIAHLKAWLVGVGLLDPPDPREDAIRDLLKSVKVKPVLDTHVFTISFADQNPQRAAAVVNAVADAYLVHHTRIFSYEHAADVYRGNMERVKAELDRLEAERGSGAGDPANSGLAAKRESTLIAVVRARDRIGDLRMELADTLARFTPEHTRARALSAKIADAESQLQELQNQIQALSAAKDRADAIQPLIQNYRETYSSYKKQYEQAILTQGADRQIINTHVIDFAAVPARPRFPRLVYIIVALIGGGALALGIALLQEYYDHRVETPEVAERLLGAPVIGSVPYEWWSRP